MAERYPQEPGAKGNGVTFNTSIEATADIAPRVAGLRHIALYAVCRLADAMRGGNAEEVAAFAWATRAAIQPRLSELRALGLIAPTGERRFNDSGKRAAVWAPTEKGRAAL